MKKNVLYFAAAAAMLAGCAKEAEQPEVTTAPEVVMVDISLTATMEKENGVTKATVDDTDGSFAWVKGDQVAVFTKNGNLIVLEAEEAGSTTTLTGKIAEDDALEEGAIAYYPAAIAVKDDATKVNMPSSYESADAARQGFPMRGVLNAENKLEFKHLGGMVKVTAKYLRDEIDQVVVTLPRTVTGELPVTQSGDVYIVSASGDTPSTITIGIGPEQVTRSSGTGEGVFYVPLPVGNYGAIGYVFKSSLYGTFGEKSKFLDFEVTRNSLKKMASFNMPGYYAALGFKFNNENYSNGAPLFETDEGWYVAANVTITSDNSSFKFYCNGDGDTSAWGRSGDKYTAVAGTMYDTSSYGINKGGITLPTGKYDLYFSPSNMKFMILTPGASQTNEFRTIYVMTDITLGGSGSDMNAIHLWGDGSPTSWPGLDGVKTMIHGIPYYKFSILKSKMPAGKYNFIIGHAASGNNGSPRFDFRNKNLTITDDSNEFFVSFTSVSYDGYSGDNNSSHDQNFCSQFSDPDQPQGRSNWGVTVTENGESTFTSMEWDNSPILVAKKVILGPGSEISIKFNNADGHAYNASAATVSINTWTDVAYTTDTPTTFKANLDQHYFCNVYFNKFSNQIKIVPRGPWAADPITVDGNFSDWDSIEGNTLTGGYNNAGNETTMKAVSNADGSKIWIYVKVDAPAGANPTSGNWLKFRVDTDNKATTGSTDGWCGGADSNEILAYILSGFNSMDSKYSPEWKYVVNDEANSVEIECGFKVGAAGITPGSTVKVFSLGYVPEQFNGATPAVVIPSID